MLHETFFNNAEVSLRDAITGEDSVIHASEPLSQSFGVGYFNAAVFARATISNSAVSDAVEIVYITALDGTADSITVLRGREGTEFGPWPAGSKLQCRVTAGMLASQRLETMFDADNYGLSICFGGNIKAQDGKLRPDGSVPKGDFAIVPNSWAIGGFPVLPESGRADSPPMSTAVEGVGVSSSVELGVAPDYDSNADYYAGSIVKLANPPHTVYSRNRHFDLGGVKAAPGHAAFWSVVAVDADGGIFRVSFEDYDDPDVWFYPSEIGFICDQHSATSTPVVSVGELDGAGNVVSLNNLASGVSLSDIDGAHQRVALTNSVKRGVKGMIFSIGTAAAGGSFKGRFYWKGLFVCSNTAAGWPADYGPPDGVA